MDILVTDAPVSISYSVNPAVYCQNVAIAANNPTVTGGAATSFSVSPALPAGLNLNPATGVISGTPAATVAAADYTITASNTCGSTQVDVNITVSPAAPSALTYTSSSPSYCVGTPIANNNPSNSGGAPAAYSVKSGIADRLNS